MDHYNIKEVLSEGSMSSNGNNNKHVTFSSDSSSKIMHLPNSYRQLIRSKSDSDLFKSSSRKVPTIGKSLSDIEKEEAKTIDNSLSIINTIFQCRQCTNKIDIKHYNISFCCPLCFLHYSKQLNYFIIK